MTAFDKEMQKALMQDAQKLRDEGVDCPDPIFLQDAETFPLAPECAEECQYAADVDMRGAHCSGRCQYVPRPTSGER